MNPMTELGKIVDKLNSEDGFKAFCDLGDAAQRQQFEEIFGLERKIEKVAPGSEISMKGVFCILTSSLSADYRDRAFKWISHAITGDAEAEKFKAHLGKILEGEVRDKNAKPEIEALRESLLTGIRPVVRRGAEVAA